MGFSPGSSALTVGPPLAYRPACQIRRQDDVPRLAVRLKIDLDSIVFGDASGGAIGGADTDQALASHQRHPAAPYVPVNGDRHGRPRVWAEGLHDIHRDFDAGGVAGPDDCSAKLQCARSLIQIATGCPEWRVCFRFGNIG